MNKIYTILFTACLLFTACDEDEYEYPNVKTDLAELIVSASAEQLHFTTDDGIRWLAANKINTKDLTTDSIYRFIVMYEPLSQQAAAGTAKIYDLEWAISTLPITIQEIKGPFKSDPVELQSIWESDKYLNMVLEVKVKDQEHKFLFVDRGITSSTDGKQTLNLELYHDRANDVEGFTQKFCMSIPLWPYEKLLEKGDYICFSWNTNKGIRTETFTYK